MPHMKDRLPKRISVRTIVPNIVTLMAFVMGLTAVRFALEGRFENAVMAIILAGVFDGLDGAVARLLRGTSRFGAELDSLSDIVSFGVAPALVVYLWSFQSLDRFGWAVALLFSVAMVLRLARFNAQLDSEDDIRKRLGYLTGVPAPAGAALFLVPMVVSFLAQDMGYDMSGLPQQFGILLPYSVIITMLMVSSLPTLSLKTVRIPRAMLPGVLMVIIVFVAGLYVQTWGVLLAVGIFYLASMPITFMNFRRRRIVVSTARGGHADQPNQPEDSL